MVGMIDSFWIILPFEYRYCSRVYDLNILMNIGRNYFEENEVCD